jgi:hypothetical protein
LIALVVAACGRSSEPAFTDTSCGMTITSAVGDQIIVSLGSTYWTFQAVSDPSVLEQVGTTMTTPSAHCTPGGGCGTTRAVFDAIGAGQAMINASRTTCGEALGCGPGQGQGICTITIVVAS